MNLQEALKRIPSDWNGSPTWREPVLTLRAAVQSVAEGTDHFMPSDYEAARNTFWAHARLAASVSSKQVEDINRAIRFAVDAAKGDAILVEPRDQ